MTTEPKRTRTRLAKAELVMALASTAQGWADDIAEKTPGVRPFDEWESDGATDQFHALCRRYDLKPADLTRILTKVAEEIENKAMRGGYAEAWDDAADVDGVSDR